MWQFAQVRPFPTYAVAVACVSVTMRWPRRMASPKGPRGIVDTAGGLSGTGAAVGASAAWPCGAKTHAAMIAPIAEIFIGDI
jgi:hypothetical protein